MQVKCEARSPSFLAWCPINHQRSLLAAATREGTVDEDFKSVNSLEIFDTAFSSDCNIGMETIGKVNSSSAFTSVSWGHATQGEQYPYGIIAGGMSDGSLTIWDINKMFKGEEPKIHTVGHVHTDQIGTLDFNHQMPKFLASGSEDGQVYVWDISNPLGPSHQKPPGNQGLHARKAVKAVAWNNVVPYILATSNQNGETCIWDLKNKRLAITFRNHRNDPATAVTWHPSNSRQLVVSYQNDQAEIWDLKHCVAPTVYLNGGHQKQRSILDVSWSPFDENVLLTSGDDGTAVLWDNHGNKMETIEFPREESNFQAEWSPQKPGVLATCSFSGQIGIHNVTSCGAHAPLWTKRPAGCGFGFGGRMVSFQSSNQQGPKFVEVYKLNKNNEIGDNAGELADILRETDKNILQEFAFKKVREAEAEEDQDERKIWEMINLFYEENYKEALFEYFGFPKREDDLLPPRVVSKRKPKAKPAPAVEDPDDFFERLGSSPDLAQEEEMSTKKQGLQLESEERAKIDLEKPAVVDEAKHFKGEVGLCNPKVREALVTKNFSLAVELSLRQNRIADALVFAKFGGSELWASTCATFLRGHDDPFICNLFQPVVDEDFSEMVARSKPEKWEETLCMILSYTDDKHSSQQYLTELGLKLMQHGKPLAAMACYMCANDLPKLFGIWGDLMQENHTDYHPMIEKIFAFTSAPTVAMKKSDHEAMSKCFGEYANYLVAEGHVEVAAKFLMVIRQTTPSRSVNQLLERIDQAYPELGIIPKQPELKTAPRRHGPRPHDKKNNRNQHVPQKQPARPVHNPRPTRTGGPPRQMEPKIPTRTPRGPGSTRPPPKVQPVNPPRHKMEKKPPVRQPRIRTPQPKGPSRTPTPSHRPGPNQPPTRTPHRHRPNQRPPPKQPNTPPSTRDPPSRNPPRRGDPGREIPEPAPAPYKNRRPNVVPQRAPAPHSRGPPSRGRQVPPRARRSTGRPEQREHANPYQPEPEPEHVAPPPSRVVNSGGFWGQPSSAQAYTGEVASDARNVLANMAAVMDDIQGTGNLNPADTRRLQSARNRMIQIQGLLSKRQITPQSYEKFADMIDALTQQDFKSALAIKESVSSNRTLKAATRNWLPAVTDLTGLARKAYR